MCSKRQTVSLIGTAIAPRVLWINLVFLQDRIRVAMNINCCSYKSYKHFFGLKCIVADTASISKEFNKATLNMEHSRINQEHESKFRKPWEKK